MKNKSGKILTVVAALLILAAIAGFAAYAILEAADKNASQNGGEAVEYIHSDIEYAYNEDGTLASEIYYKNDVCIGRTDYYTDQNTSTDYVIKYDADYTVLSIEKTSHNELGSVTYYQREETGSIVETAEYVYFDDMTTLKKRTVKRFDENGGETAEKLYYFESGAVSRRCEYINGEITLDESYDESGNVIEASAAED